MSRAAYISEVITDRLSDTLARRNLPTPLGEPTAGYVVQMVLTLALDPLLLLSHLDGFDGSFDDESGIYANGPRNGDHLR